MPEPKELAVIIVSWQVKAQLKNCLDSLNALPENEKPGEVFVVDNNSADGSDRMLEENFNWVKLIKNQNNAGFARANNQAIKQIQKPYILLLNPDTLIKPGSLIELLRAFERHSQAGIVGPKLLNVDSTIQVSVRRFPSVSALTAVLLGFQTCFRNFKQLRKYLANDFDYNKEQKVDQVMGAAFLIRKTVLDKIGLLDEKFWIWFEEVDFCKRASLAGWETWYTPKAEIIHLGGESFSQTPSVKKRKIWNKSILRYSHKYFNFLAAFWLGLIGFISLIGVWFAANYKKTYFKLLFIPILFSVVLGLFTFKVGFLSDDWDFYHEARVTQTDVLHPLITNVGGAFYRPLTVYSYAFDYALAPYNENVARIHFLFLIILIAIVFCLIVWRLTKNLWLAQFSGLLFAISPLHLEVKAWFSGRPDVLCALFIFLAILALIYAIQKQKQIIYFFIPLFSVLAFLSKETGILVLPSLFLTVLLFKERKTPKPWVWIGVSALFIGWFFYVRFLVLGILVGGYGDSQTAFALKDFLNFFRVIGIGWANWSYLSHLIGGSLAGKIRYLVIILEIVLTLIIIWKIRDNFKAISKNLLVALGFSIIFILLAMPVMSGVSAVNLTGSRYLYLASAPLIVFLLLIINKHPKKNLVVSLLIIFSLTAWFINLQPWKIASKQVKSLDTQMQQLVPEPPENAMFRVRALPGHYYGAFQWFAKKSLPETLYAIYRRPDVYASTILDPSPYCSLKPKAERLTFTWQAVSQSLKFEDSQIIDNSLNQKNPKVNIYLENSGQLTKASWTPRENIVGYRSLVINYQAQKGLTGILAIESPKGEFNLFKNPFYHYQAGENSLIINLCDNWTWLNLRSNLGGLEISHPAGVSIKSLKLVEPY
ncbi:MAG: glycosyltransferase [Patescibacteria group bacterium]|jgi:GT2 family glycosyltransferase